MEHAVRIDHINAFVSDWQRLCIPLHCEAITADDAQMPKRIRGGATRVIDPDVVCAQISEHRAGSAGATPDIKQHPTADGIAARLHDADVSMRSQTHDLSFQVRFPVGA